MIKFNYDLVNYHVSGLNFIETINEISVGEIPEFSLPSTESEKKNLPIIPTEIETVEQFFIWLCSLVRKAFIKEIPPEISTVKFTDDTIGNLTINIIIPYQLNYYYQTRNIFDAIKQFYLINDNIEITLGNHSLVGN